MRTPGRDFELAAGFLVDEDIISSASGIRAMTSPRPNVVVVELWSDAVMERPKAQRGFVMTSACGLCGKESLESLAANRCPVLPPGGLKIDAEAFHRLPQQLRQSQGGFASPGRLHAPALFRGQG